MEDTDNNIIERIETVLQEPEGGLTPERYSLVEAYISDDDKLAASLPKIKKLLNDYKANIETCDQRAKTYTENKKLWKTRSEQVMGFLGYILKKLGHKKYEAGDAKAKITVTEVLELDEDSIITPYTTTKEYAQLRAVLPDWVKISFNIDKKALTASMKIDPTYMTQHPERVHFRENKSVSLR